jgi:signal recognition particle GTPase
MNTSTGGGVATQAGINYQNRVAAWLAVRVLAEQDASPLWGLPASSTLEFLRCETEQPVDDIMVGTSEGGHAFIQVKRSLSMEWSDDSALASTINQFVRQFLTYRGTATGSRPWERPLDARRDRLVLITSGRSPASVREQLRSVLRRLRALTPGQAIEDGATNAPERSVLNALMAHISQSWQSATGDEPSDADVREIIRLLRVQVLDVEEEGDAEREAKDLLRRSVVRDATQTDSAWNALVEACARFATSRGGADREQLQRVLASEEIALNVPRSYRNDIDRLRQYSQATLESVADLSKLRVGDSGEVKIARPSTRALRDAVEEGPVVVVGDPGAGKSGAIHDLVEALQAEGRDVVFFAVDRLEARSLGALRDELGLAHDVDEILRNWPGEGPAFLITDALDAARNDQAAQTLRNLLTDTLSRASRWRVVASIRKFDLRHDVHLQKLFAGNPVSEEFRDPDFWDIRHLNVPVLSPEEMADACRQSPELLALITSISDGGYYALFTLLRNPFNLRLVGELLGAGVGLDLLTPIKTQLELLDRYWQERVLTSRSESRAEAREAVLRRAAERMVGARSLRADRAEVADDHSAGIALRDLQSSHILVDWRPAPDTAPNRYVLTFAHHVLFDYAVARLMLRGDPARMVARFEHDEELVVAIRPSLILHFQHEWEAQAERRLFWDLVFRFMRASVPEVGKLIGPSVAADLIERVADYQPLIGRLESDDSDSRRHGEQALRHLTRTVLVTQGNPARPLVGPSAPPWSELLEQATRRVEDVAYTIRPLLMRLCDLSENLTAQQRAATGLAARRLLEFAWAKEGAPDQWLVGHAIQAVCRTFESDPSASGALLRQCLEPSHLTNYAYIELPQLASEVERLVAHDPQLVEDIYSTAFTYREESTEQTDISGSRILALSSNRSQDYKHALWVLAANYRRFMESAPQHALRALIAALSIYVTERRSKRRTVAEEERFDFGGREAVLITDYSEIWDSGGTFRDDEPLRMLDAFVGYLKRLSESEARADERAALLDLIVERNRHAVIWRRLLECGAESPNTLGREVRFLAWAKPILMSYDTTRVVGEYLENVFGILDVEDRERIEGAILSIPEGAADEQREAVEHMRNRLLGCLPFESLVTEEARRIARELEAQGGAPPNERLTRITGGWVGRPTDEERLAEQGVPVEAEPNRRMQELTRPVQVFASSHQNTTPSASEITEVMPSLRALRDAIARADQEGVHPKQKDNAADYLIEACEAITKSDEFANCFEEPGAFIREVLLEGAENPRPVYNPENDPHFDEHPSWGIPAPRVDAAGGLVWLAREASCANQQLLETIDRLSRDDVPAVRFQIASRLNALYYTAPDVMWELIERMCREERSRGVLQGLLQSPLSLFAGPHADRVAELTRIIFERVVDGSGAHEVRGLCVEMFTGLYVWRDHQLARGMVFTIADDPSKYTDEAHKIAFELRGPLTKGYADTPNPDEDAIRARAFALMGRILRATSGRLNGLQSKNQGLVQWPAEDQEEAKHLLHLADSIARELYFASGAFDEETGGTDSSNPPLGDAEKRRFLSEAAPLLDELADLGVASIAHNLVKTLEYLLEFDPADVFLRIARVVRAGRAGHYQYESMAVDVIVRLVSRFMAEYQHLLREREDCRRALIETLDAFVEAGWPAALDLTYRLEDIYR